MKGLHMWNSIIILRTERKTTRELHECLQCRRVPYLNKFNAKKYYQNLLWYTYDIYKND